MSSWLASHGVDIGSGASATDQLGSATGEAVGGLMAALSSTFSGLLSLGIAVAIGAFLVYYVIVDWDNLTAWVGRHVGLDADTGAEIVEDSAVAVRRYFWALTLSAVVTAVLIGGSAWLLGIPLAFTIAVITLVTSYVPYLGAIVSGAFATLIALGSNGVDTAIAILVIILVVQNIVQTIVLVRLAGTALSLHPIVVLGATIIGAAVAGMLGAALASPAVAVAIMVQRRLAIGRAEPAPGVDHDAGAGASGVAARGAQHLSGIRPAEQHGVQQQGVHLVKQHPVAPPVDQRCGLVVGREHPLEVRRAEQREHREVGLA